MSLTANEFNFRILLIQFHLAHCENVYILTITSEAKIVSDRALKTRVEIHLAAGEKCARCWKVLPEVKVNHGLCNRCEEVVHEKV